MEYFFSRRKLVGNPQRPTGQKAGVSTFIELPGVGTPQPAGRVLSPHDWARKVHARSANNQVLIVVHGFNVLQHSFVKNLNIVRRNLAASGYRGAVVGYDWPSDGGIENYWSDWDDAHDIAEHLIKDGVAALVRTNPAAKVHLLGHSMGSYVIARGLRRAWNDTAFRKFTHNIGQVVLTAPDVDLTWAAPNAWMGQIARLASKRMTSYISDRDLALSFAETQGHPGTKRLGRNVPPDNATDRFMVVDCSAHYTKRNLFSKLRHSHSWYYSSKDFYADAAEALMGRTQTQRRQKLGSGHFDFRK